MTPKETVQDVYNLVKSCLANQNTQFILYTTPPKLNMENSFINKTLS